MFTSYRLPAPEFPLWHRIAVEVGIAQFSSVPLLRRHEADRRESSFRRLRCRTLK